MRILRPSPVIRGRWSAGASAAGGATAVLLALGPVVGQLAEATRVHIKMAERLEPYLGFVFAFLAAMVGVTLATGLFLVARRLGRPWLAPLLILVAAASLGAYRARWLGVFAPLAVLGFAPWVAPGRTRAVPSKSFDPFASYACLAAEGACLAVGLWCPFSVKVPALLLPLMFVSATAVAGWASRLGEEARWRLVFAGLPALAMPFVGLERNPDLRPLRIAVLLVLVLLTAFARFPAAGARAGAFARRWAFVLCVPASVLIVLLPWHFRDMGAADHAGHEGQHLGWINSIHFGKMMMADAGFTYGPLREYTLAALARILGGATLETVRLAHVAVNVLGLVLLFGAVVRVSGRQIHAALLGLVLLLTHSALVALMTYQQTYSFGWADATRGGLPVLSIVVALTRPRGERLVARQLMAAAGLLAGLSLLYSHDQGVPAVVATILAVFSEVLVRREGLPWRARLYASLHALRAYGIGIAVVLVPFAAIYAAHGKLLALVAGYRWTFEVSRGAAPFAGATWSFGPKTFGSLDELTKAYEPSGSMDARALDFVMGPVLAMAGMAHAIIAALTRRYTARSTLVFALASMQCATLMHVFMAADPWHIDNATTPGLVLLVAMVAGGGAIRARWRGRTVVPLGAVAALLIPLFWLATCSTFTLDLRLARITKGEELPSFGKPYVYDDMPRAGDVGMQPNHVDIVRFIREHSKPTDPVLSTTWLLGGGTEAFLSERRNPTSFDKPDEIVSDAQRARLLRELEADPPLLIVGQFFDYFGDDVRKYIDKHWEPVSGAPSPGVKRRK